MLLPVTPDPAATYLRRSRQNKGTLSPSQEPCDHPFPRRPAFRLTETIRLSSFFTCILQVVCRTVLCVPKKSHGQRRSACPVSISLEIFGDRWSLLIVRDLMIRGFRRFKDFQHSGEGIATNILADRLRRLEDAGILATEADPEDARRRLYRLTQKGIDLAPVLFEILVWGTKHEETGAPCEVIAHMAQNREAILAEVRRRWEQHDPTPLLPWLGGPPN